MAFLAKWFRYNVIFSKAVFSILGLILVHSWAESGLVPLLSTHLTDDDDMSLKNATVVVNLLNGISGTLVVIMVYLSETYLGQYLALICTTTAYIFGLLLFNNNEGFVYAAVVLIGLGRAGFDANLKEFLTDQCRTAAEDEKQAVSRRKVWWRLVSTLGVIAALFLFTEASWAALCTNLLIAMVVAIVLFVIGTPINKLHFMYMLITNRRQRHPLQYNRAYIQTLSIVKRWVDIAAVDESLEEVRVGTVEQVEWKSLLTMLPLWLAFLVYGLVLSTADIFFYQQTNYTANYLGPISAIPDDHSCNDTRLHISNKVPVEIIFTIIRFSVDFLVSRLCDLLSSLCRSEQKNFLRNMLVRCGVGLAVSPICCLVAWRIEEYRKHQRMDNAICIRFSWLIPQFVLLGLMEGIVLDGLQNIYTSLVSKSLHLYGPPFTQFAVSIGYFISLILISIFHEYLDHIDLDLSRLGVYYKELTYACCGNLVFYFCIAMYYAKQESCDADEVIEPPLQQLHSPEEGLELVVVAGEKQ